MIGEPSILRIDRGGALIAGDGRLAALNRDAGGGEGLPLALASIASIARLAQRLGIVVARTATVADGEDDVDLWVRARPLEDETRIEADGWGADHWGGAAYAAAADPFDLAEADFAWRCDSAMMLTMLSPADAEGMASIGDPLTRVFDFAEGDGLVQLLTAAANRAGFADQPARLTAGSRPVLLSGQAILSANGAFAGFAGSGRFADRTVETAAPDVPNATGLGEGFAEKLDRALRTPLQRIVAHADSIGAQSDGPVRPEYVEYAQDISSAARHLMGLVDDLVDLSAIERPDFAVSVEAIDLADVARRAAGLLAVRAANADMSIARPTSDETLRAMGEYRRALQILVNLVGNAVRYSPRGSTVWLRLAEGDDAVSVTVADQGRGITVADQQRIFEKFGRVDPNEPGGNGLGLYIARRLARAMGGDITVESEPGQGARFTLTLPAG